MPNNLTIANSLQYKQHFKLNADYSNFHMNKQIIYCSRFQYYKSEKDNMILQKYSHPNEDLLKEFPDPAHPVRNAFISPFKHVAFVIFVLVWAVTCIVFVTYNHIVTGK